MANNTDLIVRLRAETDRLRADLNRARGEMKRFQSTSASISRAIQSNFAMMFGGVAITQGLRMAINSIAQFEYQMDKVAAISRASASEMELLTKNARDLGAKSKFTATEIGKLQEELARLGFSAQQIVNMTDASRQLATVADTELAPAAQAVGKMLNAFNLEATESERVANVMAESFSKTALNLEEFTTGMAYAASAGKSAGFSIENVTTMLGILVDNGIQGSKAGTGLRDIFIDLSVKGLTLEGALEKIRNSTDKNKTAFEIFGKTSANQAVILAENTDRFRQLNGELSDTNKELKSMTEIMEGNLLTDWQLFTSALDAAIQKGGALNPILRKTVQNLTDMMGVIDSPQKFMIAAASGFSTEVMNRISKITELEGELNKRKEDRIAINRQLLKDEQSKGSEFDVFKNILGEEAPAKKSPSGKASEAQSIGRGRDSSLSFLDDLNAELDAEILSVRDKGTAVVDSLEEMALEVAEAMESAYDHGDSVEQGFQNTLDSMRRMREEQERELKALQQSYIDFGPIIASSIGDAAALIGSTMAEGGNKTKKVFDGFIEIYANNLMQLGQALTAHGIALLAAQASISNPVAAIAAGAMAVATGAALKAAINKGGGKGAGSSGGGARSGGGGTSTFNHGQSHKYGSEPKSITPYAGTFSEMGGNITPEDFNLGDHLIFTPFEKTFSAYGGGITPQEFSLQSALLFTPFSRTFSAYGGGFDTQDFTLGGVLNFKEFSRTFEQFGGLVSVQDFNLSSHLNFTTFSKTFDQYGGRIAPQDFRLSQALNFLPETISVKDKIKFQEFNITLSGLGARFEKETVDLSDKIDFNFGGQISGGDVRFGGHPAGFSGGNESLQFAPVKLQWDGVNVIGMLEQVKYNLSRYG